MLELDPKMRLLFWLCDAQNWYTREIRHFKPRELAVILGTTRQLISRTLKDWKTIGLVSYRIKSYTYSVKLNY